MIYLTVGEKKIIVIEPGNMKALKEGTMVTSPEKDVAILYTPDIEWFGEKLRKIIHSDRSFDPEAFDRVHKESLKRAEVVDRPYHPVKVL